MPFIKAGHFIWSTNGNLDLNWVDNSRYSLFLLSVLVFSWILSVCDLSRSSSTSPCELLSQLTRLFTSQSWPQHYCTQEDRSRPSESCESWQAVGSGSLLPDISKFAVHFFCCCLLSKCLGWLWNQQKE